MNKKIIYKNGNQYYLGILLNPDSEKLHLAYMTNKNTYGLHKEFEPKLYLFELNACVSFVIEYSELGRIKEELKNAKDLEIEKLKQSLKSTIRADYSVELQEEYDRLKELIIKNMERSILEESMDINDNSFENRLKEICKLKKQIFSIPCDGAKDARKDNGTVKYNIKQIETAYDRQMDSLNEEYFKQLMGGDSK